jgi:CRP-like cAMP-binding protein
MPAALAKNGWPAGNLVLSAVPAAERDALLPHLELVQLAAGRILYRATERITHLYFPIDSAVAKVGVDRRGATAEYVLLGKEGLVGLNALLGDFHASGHAIVQIPGRSYRAGVAPLGEVFERSLLLRRAILRYVSSRVFQTSQTSLCNARHSTEQRLCRWLLQAVDRAGRAELPVTHELIGVALGLRREAVTMTALRLQARGVIRCGRGRIAVPERARLEAASCECYVALRRDLETMARDIAAL